MEMKFQHYYICGFSGWGSMYQMALTQDEQMQTMEGIACSGATKQKSLNINDSCCIFNTLSTVGMRQLIIIPRSILWSMQSHILIHLTWYSYFQLENSKQLPFTQNKALNPITNQNKLP